MTGAYTGRAPDAGAYESGMPLWKAGAKWPPPADTFDLPIEAEVARSWALSHKHNNFIPIPIKFRNSKELNDEFKTKLQSIYATCWNKGEINRRRTAILKRGKPESSTYAKHHKVVAELHKLVYQRFVNKAIEQLKGDELDLFLRANR